MRREEKQILLKDLSARLPYEVKCKILETNEIKILYCINYDGENTLFDFWVDEYKIDDYQFQLYLSEFKPYLFPLSSMTDEQRKELEELGLGYYVTCQDIDDDGWDEKVFQIIPGTETDDWMNAHHFDYRGLIEKNLALDATDKNIY